MKEFYTGKSLYMFSYDNCLRRAIIYIFTNERYTQLFDNSIAILILLSTVILAFESPTDDPLRQKLKVFRIIDLVMTVCFALEMVIKIIAFGFVFNGKNSYLR